MVQPPSVAFTLAELKALQKLEAEREANRAFIAQADEDFLFLFGELCTRLGVDFPEDDLQAILDDSAIVVAKLKFHFNRARPYQVAELAEERLIPIATKTGHSPAYPSGHTLQSKLLAHELAARNPEHAQRFHRLAWRVSWSRAQGGVHWPSDLCYGEQLANHLVAPRPTGIIVAHWRG